MVLGGVRHEFCRVRFRFITKDQCPGTSVLLVRWKPFRLEV
jgi:hypothetical protein